MASEEINSEEDIVTFPEDWAVIKPYHQTIVLNDDTVLDGYAMRSSIADEVWIYPKSKTLSYLDLAMIFSNPDKTEVIQSNIMNDQFVEYHGYTRLASITAQTDGTYIICMTKPIE